MNQRNNEKRRSKQRMYQPVVRAVLRSWFVSNLESPYPSEEQVRELAQETGLTQKQVRVWLTNQRSVSKAVKLRRVHSVA